MLQFTTNVMLGSSSKNSSAHEILERIYRKGQIQQWVPEQELSWQHQLNDDNPLAMPDGNLPIAGTEIWDRLPGPERTEVRKQFQSWQISQIYHGEQASLLCAAKIALTAPDQETKKCLALQVADEARHSDIFSKLIETKMPYRFAMSPVLKSIFESALCAPDYDYASIGMQILVEGMALGFFKAIQAHSSDEFIRKLHTLVLRDEARHFAVGRVSLAEFYRDASTHEKAMREEYIVECCHGLSEHLCADEVWEAIGFSRQECAKYVRKSRLTAEMRRSLFRRIVPSVASIGLLGPETTRYFTSIDMIDYAHYPIN